MIRFIKEQFENLKLRFSMMTKQEIIFELCLLLSFLTICILGVLLNQ